MVDNFVHDLHSSTGVNDGISTKGDTREMLLMNNYIEHVDGHAISLEGLNLSVKSSNLNGAKGAAVVTGCTGCTFERNEIVNSAGKAGVELRVGDSPIHATLNIKLVNNCVHQSSWLVVEQGSEAGLIQQNNSDTACR